MQHVSLLSKKKNKNKNAVAWTRPHVPWLCIVPVHSQQVSSFSVLKETLRKRSKQLKHFRFLFSSQSVLTQTKHLVYRERLLKKEALKTCTILIAIPHSAAFFFFFFLQWCLVKLPAWFQPILACDRFIFVQWRVSSLNLTPKMTRFQMGLQSSPKEDWTGMSLYLLKG